MREAAELQPGLPDKPANLSDRASVQWDRLIDEMERSGIVLIPAYRAAIAQAATISADLQVAWERIKTNGRYVCTKTGVEKLSAAVEDTAKLNDKLSKALWQLGLTPRSRGIGVAVADNDQEPPLEDILNDEPAKGSVKLDGHGFIVD
jgi:phage terminase small subunit